jgi:hypothetical protein
MMREIAELLAFKVVMVIVMFAMLSMPDTW